LLGIASQPPDGPRGTPWCSVSHVRTRPIRIGCGRWSAIHLLIERRTLGKRRFRTPAPARLLVADFTYVRLAGGMFAYTAFVIEAFANRILGWECSTSKHTRFVEAAIHQAATIRAREGHLDAGPVIHHSDAGSQYTSVHLGETLLMHGMVPSIGTVGDAFDNALAETTIEPYKHECIRADSPFRRGPLDRLSDLEMITADWVH
jgi:putative transposase